MATNPTIENTEFTWAINNLEVITNHDSLENVIKSVHFVYSGIFENNEGIIDGQLQLEAPDPENYKPYETITKEEVISWICAKYDTSLFKKNIVEQIQAKLAVPVTSILSVPWATEYGPVDVSNNTIKTVTTTKP